MWSLVVAFCLVWTSPGALAASRYSDTQLWTPRQIATFMDLYQQSRFSSPVEDTDFSTGDLGLGTVAAVDVDSNDDLFILHRAHRPWTANTFDSNNRLTQSAQVPLASDTILKVDPTNARLISSFGANFFNVPHGLKLDSNDNVWVTDVGRHQVFRFPKNATTPDLTLGEKFVPGSDNNHFCKPTDVAVASNGEFFVSDGYCNSRIMKFSKDGNLIHQWGQPQSGGQLTPFTLNIPHSVTLMEDLDIVCVADRENQRALCYRAAIGVGVPGKFVRTLVPQGDMGNVYAIYYNSADHTVIAAGETSRVPYYQAGQAFYPARAFTYSLAGVQTDAWARITPATERRGPSLIHDLCASRDGRHFFLADLLQQRVLKYTVSDPPAFQQGWK